MIIHCSIHIYCCIKSCCSSRNRRYRKRNCWIGGGTYSFHCDYAHWVNKSIGFLICTCRVTKCRISWKKSQSIVWFTKQWKLNIEGGNCSRKCCCRTDWEISCRYCTAVFEFIRGEIEVGYEVFFREEISIILHEDSQIIIWWTGERNRLCYWTSTVVRKRYNCRRCDLNLLTHYEYDQLLRVVCRYRSCGVYR